MGQSTITDKQGMENQDKDYLSFVTEKGNTIWAGALCLAWAQLSQKFANNQEIKLSQSTSKIQIILNKLNKSKFTDKDISSKSVYIKSGYGSETVKLKFPQSTIANVETQLGQNDILSYAYLFKNLPFKLTFQVSKQLKPFNGKQKYQYFYPETQRQRAQVWGCSYQDPNNFIVTIESKEQNEEIYLIKSSKKLKVKDAIQKTKQLKHTKQEWQRLRQCDIFEMPVISLDVRRQLKEILNIPIQNQGLKGKMFSKVLQVLKLDINQAGAKVQNKAQIAVDESAFIYEDPKNYIFDTTFWVVMRQKEKHPYLAICINDPKDC